MITREGFELFGYFVYWYAVLIALGIAAALFTASKRERLLGLKRDTAFDITAVCVPAGIIGARLYYVILRPELFHSLRDVLNLRSGGLAIYGGIIAGVLAGAIYARIRRVSFVTLCDLAAPGLALAQAIGRWGNFLNQEAYGVRMTCLQFFPISVYIEAEQAWFAATFFYESLSCACIAAVILLSGQRFSAKGTASAFYLMSYAFERCIVEGLRSDSLYLCGIRASQALSALVLIGFATYAIVTNKKGSFIITPIALLLLYGVFTDALLITALAALPLFIFSSRSLLRGKSS